MGEEESVNAVSKTDSNGNSTLETALDDTSEKKDCELMGGKILENNAVKDLKEDGIKEMEVDKKTDGEEDLEMKEDKKADGEEVLEMQEDKKADDSEVIKDNKKVGEDGKKVYVRGKLKEARKKVGTKEAKDDKKDDFVNAMEENKKDDNEFEKVNEKSNEEVKVEDIKVVKRLKKCARGKTVGEKSQEAGEDDKVDDKSNEEDKDDVKIVKLLKKRGRGKVDVEKMENEIMEQKETKGISEGKNESSEKDEKQEREEECKDKVDNKSNEADAAEDIEVEKGLKNRGRGKVDVEKTKTKVKEQKETKGIPEGKNESSENDERQEGEEDGKDKVDNKSNEEDGAEDVEVEKGLKKSGRGNINAGQAKNEIKELKETEPRTPTTTNRPVRERKSVNRLIESAETDTSKEFHIEKGRGTPLKDIPNVAFKLSRRTVDDNLKLLHTILFSRRGKAAEIKNNISSFSGFAWDENEEKQMIKIKEKFDKCNKENLMEFCDVLDMPVTNPNTRKEDIIAKLIDYLVAPKEKSIKGKKRTAKQGSSRSETATPRSSKSRKKNEDSSVAEKKMITTYTESESVKEDKVEEKNKNNVPDDSEDKKLIQEKKRKRIAKQDSSETRTTRSRRSVKSRQNEDSEVAEVKRRSTDAENEAEEGQKDEKNEAENGKGVADKSKDEMPEKSESEDKNDCTESEDAKKVSKTTRTSLRQKESAAKSKAKKITVETKPRTARKRTSNKPLSTHSESDHDDSEGRLKVFARKKKNVKQGKQKNSSLTESSSKSKTEKVTEREDKSKEKSNPSEDQLRKGIRDLFKVVDFNTATFKDTVELLGKRFNVDLTPRKASIKTIIQEELTKLVAEDLEKEERGEVVEDSLKKP